MNRTKHTLALVTAVLLAVVPLWADAAAPLAVKIAGSIATAAALLFSRAKIRESLHIVLAVCTVAGSLVTVIAGNLGAGTTGAVIAGTALAVLTNLRAIFARDFAAVDDDKTPAVPPRNEQRGSVAGWVLAIVAGVGLGLSLLLAASTAKAEQQFGGCTLDQKWCAGPAVAVTVGQFNLSTSKFSGGLSPGVGYGLTWRQAEWYATGLAGYLAFTVGGGEPNQAMPSLLLSFANYVRVGAGVSITETDGPVELQWRLLFGLGTDFGGSPDYVRAKAGAR